MADTSIWLPLRDLPIPLTGEFPMLWWQEDICFGLGRGEGGDVILGTANLEVKQGTHLRTEADTGTWIFSDITELLSNSSWCCPDP